MRSVERRLMRVVLLFAAAGLLLAPVQARAVPRKVATAPKASKPADQKLPKSSKPERPAPRASTADILAGPELVKSKDVERASVGAALSAARCDVPQLCATRLISIASDVPVVCRLHRPAHVPTGPPA